MNGRTIIVYFSHTGNTRRIVNELHKKFGWPLVAIEPVKPMRLRGILKYFWGGFRAISGHAPRLKRLDVDWDAYDNIVVAGPIWAGHLAPAVRSFLTGGHLLGKNIHFLYTHEGGPGRAIFELEKIIATRNTLRSTCSCLNVAKDYEKAQEGALEWAKNL